MFLGKKTVCFFSHLDKKFGFSLFQIVSKFCFFTERDIKDLMDKQQKNGIAFRWYIQFKHFSEKKKQTLCVKTMQRKLFISFNREKVFFFAIFTSISFSSSPFSIEFFRGFDCTVAEIGASCFLFASNQLIFQCCFFFFCFRYFVQFTLISNQSTITWWAHCTCLKHRNIINTLLNHNIFIRYVQILYTFPSMNQTNARKTYSVRVIWDTWIS